MGAPSAASSGRSPTPRRTNAWATPAPWGQPWPHVQQVRRIERRRIRQTTGEVETEVSYAITSRPAAKADAHALLGFARGHWGIENRLHYVRDGAFDEDRCQVRTGAAPEAFAVCRDLALGALRQRRVANVAAALRSCAWRPTLAVRLIRSAGAKR